MPTTTDLPPLPKGFFVEPVPDLAAQAWIRDKPVVSAEVYERLLPELKSRALGVAGIECAGVLRRIRAAIAEVPAGADWVAQRRIIAELVHPYVADPARPNNYAAARRKAELLLRTHGFQAYAVGSHEVMREQEPVFPWWQYLTISDELVRPTHGALDKLILPASSPFWRRHSPPWEWGCRCRKVPLLPEEVEEQRTREAAKPLESKTVIEGEALRYLEAENRLDRGPARLFDVTPPGERREGGFLFEPDSLRLSPDQLQSRYDPQTWADYRSWAERTPLADQERTVWEWMQGKEAARFSVSPGRAETMLLSERQAENAVLFSELPRREHPLTSIFQSPGQDVHSLSRRKAVLLAEAAHDDGALPQCSMVTMPAGGADCGDYGLNLIRIHPFADQPLLVTLHEMGHHIVRHTRPKARPAFEQVVQACCDSERGQVLVQRALAEQSHFRAYWASPEEFFCRAYSQWIAVRTRDPELSAEVQSVLMNPDCTLYQWPDDEFAPISAAVEHFLHSIGFL